MPKKDKFNPYQQNEIKLKKRFDDDYKNFFHFIKTNWKKVLIIIVCSLFYAFGQVHFMLKAASVLDGVEAISVSLAYIIPVLKPYLTILYLLLNLPLIIFFWKKIKKSFIISTLIFLFFNALFGFIFGYDPVDKAISEHVIVIVRDANKNPDTNINNYINLGWPVFVYVILAVTCCSPSSAIIWKLGSSTGGTDIIAYYISSKLKKPVGFFLMATGTLMATIGILFLFISKKVMPENIKNHIYGFDYILGPQTFGTFLYIFLNGFIINLIYPKYNKVKLRIDTKNVDDVIRALKAINFWHPYKIEQSISGYNRETVYSIESIVLLLESDDIANYIKYFANDTWISMTPVSKIYGRFNYSKID